MHDLRKFAALQNLKKIKSKIIVQGQKLLEKHDSTPEELWQPIAQLKAPYSSTTIK